MKKYSWRLSLSIGLIGLSVFLGSCDKRAPVKPVDERQNKLHEDPAEAKFILQEGTMDAQLFAGNPEIKQFTPNASAPAQTIIIKAEDGGRWGVAQDSPNKAFKVKSKLTNPNTVYLLKVFYKNFKNEDMNYQFVTGGQESIHQHFFMLFHRDPTTKESRGSFSLKELPYIYKYADTDPHDDDQAKLTDDPRGFKGFFQFTGDNASFDMTIILVHSYDPKYKKNPSGGAAKDANGRIQYYSFHKQKSERATTDFSFALPFAIGDGREMIQYKKHN